MRLLPRCWRLAVPHDRLGRRAGRPADASAPFGSDRGGGRAGVGGGLGGDAMKVNRIWYYRTAARLTQQAFAQSLGLAIATVVRWENGVTSPDIAGERKLLAHCEAYRLAYTCPICEVTR